MMTMKSEGFCLTCVVVDAKAKAEIVMIQQIDTCPFVIWKFSSDKRMNILPLIYLGF